MNKLMGFYELKDSSLPTIDWKQYTGKEMLSNERLWTIRTAVFNGDDFNLPRLVGVNGKEANETIKTLFQKFKDNGMVIYYPFFIAEKSGTLNISNDKIVIEAVKEDLWNLVTDSKVDLTIIKDTVKDSVTVIGNEDFLTEKEISELISNIPTIKKMFRDFLHEGKSILLEWSFAHNCNIDRTPTGEKYLVFYEARCV